MAAKPQPVTLAALRNRLKLRQLVLLAELESAGSLHKAAERLGISQPAATRLLRELESLMDAELFERTSRGMSPTDMGRLLMRHAAMLLNGVDQMHQQAAAVRSGAAGSLVVGLYPGTAPELVTDALLQVKRGAPRMDVRLVHGAGEALLEGLHEGRFDLLVGRAPTGDGEGVLDFELLYMEHFSVVCGAEREHPPASSGFDILVQLPWILPTRDTALRRNLELVFLGACGRMPADVIETTTSAVASLLVTRGGRLAAVPSWLAREQAGLGLMRVLVPPLSNLSGPVGVTRRSRLEASVPVATFVAALHEACAHLAAGAADDPDSESPAPNN